MYEQHALQSLRAELQQLKVGPVLTCAPLHTQTTWRIGGPADILLRPPTIEALQTILAFAQKRQLPLTLLGSGSNVLVSDKGLRGLVVHLAPGLNAIDFHGTQVTAQSGALISTLAYQAAQHSLSGLAWAEGIPGSVGGAVVMNAGAYGGRIADCLQSVTYLTPEGALHTVTAESFELAYRSSAFQSSGSIIVSADFALTPGDRQAILAEMALYHEKRQQYQPLELPSAGSVFKNPPGQKAARLIEAAGAKGWRVGDAQVSPKHCNFIVNCGHAACADVLALMARVQQAVLAHSGILLEREVILLGEEKMPLL